LKNDLTSSERHLEVASVAPRYVNAGGTVLLLDYQHVNRFISASVLDLDSFA